MELPSNPNPDTTVVSFDPKACGTDPDQLIDSGGNEYGGSLHGRPDDNSYGNKQSSYGRSDSNSYGNTQNYSVDNYGGSQETRYDQSDGNSRGSHKQGDYGRSDDNLYENVGDGYRQSEDSYSSKKQRHGQSNTPSNYGRSEDTYADNRGSHARLDNRSYQNTQSSYERQDNDLHGSEKISYGRSEGKSYRNAPSEYERSGDSGRGNRGGYDRSDDSPYGGSQKSYDRSDRNPGSYGQQEEGKSGRRLLVNQFEMLIPLFQDTVAPEEAMTLSETKMIGRMTPAVIVRGINHHISHRISRKRILIPLETPTVMHTPLGVTVEAAGQKPLTTPRPGAIAENIIKSTTMTMTRLMALRI